MKIRTKSSLRGVRDIRTHSGMVDHSDIPYMAYMRISSLEMEKARRERERFSAQTRIRNIEKRLSEIEIEKGELLVRLGERALLSEPGARVAVEKSPQARANEKKVGFRIKY